MVAELRIFSEKALACVHCFAGLEGSAGATVDRLEHEAFPFAGRERACSLEGHASVKAGPLCMHETRFHLSSSWPASHKP